MHQALCLAFYLLFCFICNELPRAGFYYPHIIEEGSLEQFGDSSQVTKQDADPKAQ